MEKTATTSVLVDKAANSRHGFQLLLYKISSGTYKLTYVDANPSRASYGDVYAVEWFATLKQARDEMQKAAEA
jgi:hypothetical protein